jgi:hypothetical protein
MHSNFGWPSHQNITTASGAKDMSFPISFLIPEDTVKASATKDNSRRLGHNHYICMEEGLTFYMCLWRAEGHKFSNGSRDSPEFEPFSFSYTIYNFLQTRRWTLSHGDVTIPSNAKENGLDCDESPGARSP